MFIPNKTATDIIVAREKVLTLVSNPSYKLKIKFILYLALTTSDLKTLLISFKFGAKTEMLKINQPTVKASNV